MRFTETEFRDFLLTSRIDILDNSKIFFFLSKYRYHIFGAHDGYKITFHYTIFRKFCQCVCSSVGKTSSVNYFYSRKVELCEVIWRDHYHDNLRRNNIVLSLCIYPLSNDRSKRGMVYGTVF